MKRGLLLAVGALTLALVLAGLAWRVPGLVRVESKRERARQFYLTAVDRAARHDEAAMTQALRSARTADSTYLPALLPLALSHVAPATTQLAELDSFAATLSDRSLGVCVSALASAIAQGWWHPIVPPPHPSEAASLCLSYHRLLRDIGLGSGERLEAARRLWRTFPDHSAFAEHLLSELAAASEEAIPITEEMARRGHPARVRLLGYTRGIERLHASGRHAEAIEREREAQAELSGEPETVRLEYARKLAGFHRGLLGAATPDSAVATHARTVMASSEREARDLAAHAGTWGAMSQRFERGSQLLDDGKLEASRTEWDTLVRLTDSLGEPQLLANALVRRGRALVKLGRTVEAERDLVAARAAAQRANSLAWMYEAEHNLLHLYEGAGREPEARRAGEAFLALTRMGRTAEVYLMANRDLGWHYQRRGERELARPYFETMLVYADSIGGSELQWAGEYFELTGDLDRAEADFSRVGLGADTYRAYAGLERLAEATGDMNRALSYARAHDAGMERANYPEVAPLLPGLLARSGRLSEAATELEGARGAASSRGQVAAWAKLSAELADVRLRLGMWPAAAAAADSAAKAATEVALTEVRLRAEAISGLARVHAGGASRAGGLARIRGALREAERMQVRELLAVLLEQQAEAWAVAGDAAGALTLLARAADLTDSMAVQLSADPRRAGLRAAHVRVSNLALQVILEHSNAPAAAERFAEWSVRRKSRGVLERRFGSAAPVGAVLPAVRSRLGPGDAVIDYVVLDTAVVALVVTNTGAVLRPLPIAADSLRLRVGRLLARLTPRMGNVVDTLHARFDTALAARLYVDLLAPLERELGARDRLTIVADGPLHQLPFDALVIGGKRMALDRFTISLAPSLAVAGGGDHALPGGAVVAVAGESSDGSLAGASDEIQAILSAFGPARVLTFTGAQATEASIRAHAPSATLLHFAAHARANDADPGSARIALAPADGDDGLLHAYEIDALRLPGSLVVLSACETGAGRLLGGEGVLSLSRAFLRAGASATVATLWPVGPSTAELMSRFYRDLAAGLPPARALRNAKLALARRPGSGPLSWAPFVLVSRSR